MLAAGGRGRSQLRPRSSMAAWPAPTSSRRVEFGPRDLERVNWEVVGSVAPRVRIDAAVLEAWVCRKGPDLPRSVPENELGDEDRGVGRNLGRDDPTDREGGRRHELHAVLVGRAAR